MKEPLARAVAATLKTIALDQKIDQKELSTRTGYHHKKVFRLLNGQTAMGIDDADILSRHLGAEIEQVLALAKAKTPNRPMRAAGHAFEEGY